MATYRIPFSPRTVQQSILDSMTFFQFFTAVCHRRLGKTVLAANWLIKEAFSLTQPNYRGYYIAPNQRQAKHIVWAYFKQYLAPLGKLVNFNETELRIDLPNGGRIYLAGAENIESLRGIYIDRAVLDEMASWQNPRYAFFEVLYPAMTDRRGHALIIGTVKGLDLFHEFYQMGLDDTYPEWGSISIPVTTSGIFSPSEIAEMQRLMRPDAFAREYMNDFYAEVPDSLIAANELHSAVARDIIESHVRARPEIWGFDVGYTSDPSILAKRKGPLLRPMVELANKDSVYQARWLKDQIDQHRPQTLYIDAGYGEGVIAQLNDLGYDHIILPVWFNSKSPKPNCVNMRSFMYNELKKWLTTGSIPKDEKLIRQASNQLLDESDADRRIKLQPKKKIKELIGESPDRSDALALTFAGGEDEALNPDQLTTEQVEHLSNKDALDMIRSMNQQRSTSNYDPLSYMEQLEKDCDIDLTDLI